jgi:hypothetical protein
MKVPAVSQRIRLLSTGACGTVILRFRVRDGWTIHVKWEKGCAGTISIPRDEWENA